MTDIHSDVDKYEVQSSPPTIVDIFHGALKDLMRTHLSAGNEVWKDFVFGRSYELVSAAAISQVEQRTVAEGYRYIPSATISAEERPDAYVAIDDGSASADQFSFEHDGAVVEEADASGRQRCGQGDNVVEYPANVIGIARYFRSIKDVMGGLSEGVPAGTIAIIDDSGGTLTAPILEQFSGVICAGGTVKSHLGILTREYGIPCLMNARISGIRNGDLVEIEVSGAAKTMEAYQAGEDLSVRVWKVPQGEISLK